MKWKITLALSLLPLLVLPHGGTASGPFLPTGVFHLKGDLTHGACVVEDVHLRYALADTGAGWLENLTLSKDDDRIEGDHWDHWGIARGEWNDACLTTTSPTLWESTLWSAWCSETGKAKATVLFREITVPGGAATFSFEGTGTCVWT